MSTPSTSIPTSDVPDWGVNLVDSLLSNVKWGGPVGTGTTVTYSFPWTTSTDATYSGAVGYK